MMMIIIAGITAGCRARGITGEEWIRSRGESLNIITQYAASLDDTVVLYASGGINSEAFACEMDVRVKEYEILRKQFDQEIEENPIRPGSHSYMTKSGYEGFTSLWKDIGDLTFILDDMSDKGASPDEISYQYLAYKPVLGNDTARFMAAFYLVTGMDILAETQAEESESQGG